MFFFLIKIMHRVATMLPNVFGSTIATQGFNVNLGKLMWVVFFSKFSYI
jgi:hypothetical protein